MFSVMRKQTQYLLRHDDCIINSPHIIKNKLHKQRFLALGLHVGRTMNITVIHIIVRALVPLKEILTPPLLFLGPFDHCNPAADKLILFTPI